MTLFSHSSFRSIEPISLNEPFTQLNSTQLNHTEVKTYGACGCGYASLFIDNLIRWITLSILTFGVHIKKNAQPECFAAFHITWNFISEKLYPQKQPSTFRLFYVIAECKEKHEAKMIGLVWRKGRRSIADGRADGMWRRTHCVPYVIQLFARPFRTSLRTLRNGNQSISQCANNSIVTVLLTMS